MQVMEVAAEGLVRQYKVTVPAAEIESKVADRLEGLKGRVRIPGFRPGKVPTSLLKKQYGKSVLGEVVEEVVDAGQRQAISDNSLKPAMRPKIEITSFDEGKDLEFDLKVELLPELPAVDLAALTLDKPVIAVDEAKVEDAIQKLAQARQNFTTPDAVRPAEMGDRLTIDFVGTMDGVAFDGGTASDMPLVLGSNTLIPGFEEQLVGVGVGDTRTVAVTFPETYAPRPDFAGKGASFEVTVKKIELPEPLTIDDEFAKSVGVDDMAALRAAFQERLEAEYGNLVRQKMKRELLDKLAASYAFQVPPGMVDVEFESIWGQLVQEMGRNGQVFDPETGFEGKSEEETRTEYRGIADRRVRLGLLLSDIGTKNEVKVEEEELQRAVIAEARRFPGQERQVFEYFQKTPGAIDNIRAPIFEDKVVDLVFAQAQVTEVPTDIDSFLKAQEEEAAA